MSGDRVPVAPRGQEAALSSLASVIASDRVGVAYLLYGPEGVGRGMGAEVFARALLCAKPSGVTPCGACRPCRWNAAGTHPDFFVVSATAGPFFKDDAGAEKGRQDRYLKAAWDTARGEVRRRIPVRTLRRLIDLLALSPVAGGRKVVLVDAFDEVEEEGAATLLKSLEEPPPATTFLLLARGLESAPDTILSRCQRVRFRPLPPDLVEELLDEVGGKALRGLEPSQRSLLVRLGQGSVGRVLEAAKLGLHGPPADAARALVAGGDPEARQIVTAWLTRGSGRLAEQRRRLSLFLALGLLLVRDAAGSSVVEKTDGLVAAVAGALESTKANVTPELVVNALFTRADRVRRLHG